MGKREKEEKLSHEQTVQRLLVASQLAWEAEKVIRDVKQSGDNVDRDNLRRAEDTLTEARSMLRGEIGAQICYAKADGAKYLHLIGANMPTTEDQVAAFEREMEVDPNPPELPDSLKDPPPLPGAATNILTKAVMKENRHDTRCIPPLYEATFTDLLSGEDYKFNLTKSDYDRFKYLVYMDDDLGRPPYLCVYHDGENIISIEVLDKKEESSDED